MNLICSKDSFTLTNVPEEYWDQIEEELYNTMKIIRTDRIENDILSKCIHLKVGNR